MLNENKEQSLRIIADDGADANNLAYFDFTINISSVNDPPEFITGTWDKVIIASYLMTNS